MVGAAPDRVKNARHLSRIRRTRSGPATIAVAVTPRRRPALVDQRWCKLATVTRIAGFFWLGLTCWSALPASAQEGPTSLEFSFSNPGARSLGFGGAFVALADDATAAFANPAGLVQLARPEVSIEGRYWSYSTTFTAGGRVSGAPSGLGVDTTPGLRFGESDRDLSGVSFLSAVVPFEKGSLAFYRHQLANFEAEPELNGLFGVLPGFPGQSRVNDARTVTELEIVTYGFAASLRLSDRWSVGAALDYHEDRILSRTQLFDFDDTIDQSFYGPASFASETVSRTTTIESDGTDVTLNFGLLFKPTERWSLGGVYRMGVTTDLRVTAVSGPFQQEVPPGTIVADRNDRVELPAVWGLGVAYRSRSGAFTASFEWDRVEYSDIVARLDPAIFDSVGLVVDDADELHFGFEFAFLRSKPLVAVRAGAWLDPDHRISIRSEQRSLFDRAIFRQGNDEVHVAAGVGLVFEHIQLDFAIDLSDPADTASLSAIYAF